MKIGQSLADRANYSIATAAALLLLVALAWVGSGCVSSGKPPPPDAGTPFKTDAMNEGDVIQVAFPGATNLNATVKIPLGGTVKLAFAGEFVAAGKTPQELQEDILKVYGAQLQLKEVTVTVVNSAAAVYVSGEVLRPGKIPMDRPMTVMEAIMECGGFAPQAKPNKVRVIRNEGGRQVPYDIDMSRALSGEESNPFYLRPSDVINVPRKVVNL